MKTPLDYQQLIESSGISLRELGIADIALNREDAIRAIDLLQASATPILGGDVYIMKPNRIEHAYANWHSDPIATETRAQFAERSCSEAKRYIADYPSSVAHPIFGLVLDG